MRRFPSRLRLLLILCVTINLGCSGGPLGKTYPSHSLVVNFTKLPADDGELIAWLNGHSDWRDVKFARNSATLSVEFRSLSTPKYDSFSYILNKCGNLGYEGRSFYRGHMFDVSQRGTSWETYWLEFTTLPPDDKAVSEWLAKQTGVSQTSVSRSGNTLKFEGLLSNPPPPTILSDIEKKCEQSGYSGLKSAIYAFGRHP